MSYPPPLVLRLLKTRASGFEMKISMEAVIGFMSRTNGEAKAKPAAAGQTQKARPVDRKHFEISANDRRFLRSLRIAADETQEKQVE